MADWVYVSTFPDANTFGWGSLEAPCAPKPRLSFRVMSCSYLSGKSAEMRYILAPATPPISTTRTIEIEAINQSSIPKALNPI